jgi:hypothetical protein
MAEESAVNYWEVSHFAHWNSNVPTTATEIRPRRIRLEPKSRFDIVRLATQATAPVCVVSGAEERQIASKGREWQRGRYSD